MRKLTRLVAVAASAALFLTACGGDDPTEGTSPTEQATDATTETAEEPTEGEGEGNGEGGAFDPETEATLRVTWWGADDRADRYNEAIELFNEQYPNITIQPEFQAWGDYWTARATEAAGSSLPQTDLAYLSEFGTRGQLLDLSPYVGSLIDVSGMNEGLLQSGVLQDQQIAIPQGQNTLALFYNPATLETLGVDAPDAGQTWQEFVEWSAEAADAGASESPALYGTGDFTSVFWLFIQYRVQDGQEVFTEDGQPAFTEEDIVEWLNLVTPLRESEQVIPPERTAQLDPLGGFTANEVATEFSWDNFLAGYYTDSGAETIEMLPLPVGSNGDHGMFFKPSMLLSAGANTTEPEAAAVFIDFITNDPSVGEVFGTSRGVPSTESARSALSAEGFDEQVLGYEEEWADVITESVPVLPQGFGSIEAEWLRLGEELGYGNITPEEFAQQWFSEAQIALGN